MKEKAGLAIIALVWIASIARADGTKILVKVNGKAITQGEIEFLLVSRRVPKSKRAAAALMMMQRAIDRRIASEFLAEKKAQADKKEVEAAMHQLKQILKRDGKDPAKVLEKLGLTADRFREEVALPLAWRAYFYRVTTNTTVREFFAKRRAEFDGTRVRARQIFLKPGGKIGSAEDKKIEAKLAGLRKAIVDAKATFEDTAKKNSQSPSGAKGGDMGWFAFRGTVPRVLTKVAFRLKVDEISAPFRSPFGWHVLQITERKAGEDSLEDCRPAILRSMSNELWNKTIAERKAKAKIEWVVNQSDLPKLFAAN